MTTGGTADDVKQDTRTAWTFGGFDFERSARRGELARERR